MIFEYFARVPKTLMGTLYDLLKLEEINPSQLSDTAKKRLRRQQIRGAIDQMRVFVIGNSIFAPVLAFQAWNTGINTIVVSWTLVMLAFSWWLFFTWQRSYLTDGNIGDMNRFVAETRVNASLWCIGLVLFYPFVSGDGKTILTTIMAGSLALGTVGFSQAPRAAFWYLGIQTFALSTVPISYSFVFGSGADAMIGGLALLTGCAIFNAALERAKAQMKALINHEKISQKNEVIDLLLKDYENQHSEWLWQSDKDGKIVSGPQQVLDLMKLNLSRPAKADLLDAIRFSIDPRGEQDLRRVIDAFENHNDFHNVTLPFNDVETNRRIWIMMRGRPQFEDGIFAGFRGIFADASKAVEAQKQVEFLADHDPLTRIHNRNAVQRQLSELQPNHGNMVALLIDLDGFKQVNDSYGHTTGDLLLQVVASRLTQCVTKHDLVARLGGDEFIILLDLDTREYGFCQTGFADQVLVDLSKPYLIEQYDIVLSASIGLANFPADTEVGTNLLIQADLALYVAKQNGRNQACAFVDRMQEGLQKRILVTERLKSAIALKQIVPSYQPQYCARTGELVGAEALARWYDSELGSVGPDIFIPIAEETGLIHELGEQLMRKACEDAMHWAAQVGVTPPLISVNLSPVQVSRGNVVSLVKKILEETGLPPTRLEIEVTEGVLIDDVDGTCKVLRDLSKLGVKIALDDFGTGYSSLSYVRTLPLDRLKIDRSFIADLSDPAARSIVQTVINLCQALKLSVIAEGVETKEDASLLGTMRCDVLQGYYFSAAVPPDHFTTLLLAQEHTTGRDQTAVLNVAQR